MGWDINVYRMDFDRLLKSYGYRDERLFQQIVSTCGLDEPDGFGDEDDDYDEDDLPPLPVKEAVRHILFGVATDDDQALSYGTAMGLIYQALAADYIGDLRVAAFGIPSFFEGVDAVLAERGFPGYMSNLVMAGAPSEVPVETDGALGFLTPSDCQAFVRAHGGHDWSIADSNLKATIDDLLKWCSVAARHGHGLVAIGG